MKVFFLILCLCAGPAAAQDPAVLASRAADQLAEASRALGTADGSRNRVAALTEAVQAYEAGLAALREGMRRARARQDVVSGRLDREEAQLGQLLGVLQSMSAAPETLLLLHPNGPLGTVRSGMLVRDVTPALLEKVEQLRADLTEIATLEALQDSAAETLRDGLFGIQTARIALSKAAQDRVELPPRVAENAEQMQRLAATITTLEDFATVLSATPQDPTAVPVLEQAAGQLPLPVRGTVRLGWRDADQAGIRRPGWVVDTVPRALVTNPWPATLRYRGPLQDYGNVMILEPAADYLLVLGGLDTVYGEVGDVLPKGAPLGLMPADIAGTQGNGDEVSAGNPSVKPLYIEIRKGQQPVDPAEWFALDAE